VSEWDKSARETYKKNFEKIQPELFLPETIDRTFAGDITAVLPKSIPDFDIITGGFPCQPFSQAGLKKGFSETRGTLFFDIANIIKEKQPRAFFLENVRGLLTHDGGQTFATIRRVLTEELGYSFFYKVIKASDYGVPQHRPRLFMVGFKDKTIDFEFPEPVELTMTMDDVFDGKVNKTVGYTLRVGGRGSGIGDRRNWDTYLVDGEVRRLSPKEGLRMQGFPDDFEFPVSETQAMKQLGNSVAVPAIQATANEIMKRLK
jgi:DNA (cytosine-5)-methyltransferase 1